MMEDPLPISDAGLVLLVLATLAWAAAAAVVLGGAPAGREGLPRRLAAALAAGGAQWAALLALAAAVAGVPAGALPAEVQLAALALAGFAGLALLAQGSAAQALAPLVVVAQTLVCFGPGLLAGGGLPQPVVGVAVLVALVAAQAALHAVPSLPLPGSDVQQRVLQAALVGLAWLVPVGLLIVAVPAVVASAARAAMPWLALSCGLLFAVLGAAASRPVPVAARGVGRRSFRALRPADAAPARDALTGLAERDAVREWIARDAPHNGRFALVVFGLDGMKKINDMFGNRAGDGVVAEMGRRVAAAAAALGAPVVARTGGDEFTLILPAEADRARAAALASTVLAKLAAPVPVDGTEAHVTASAGVACAPADGDGPRMQAFADAALRAAKQAGGARVQAFEARLVDEARDRLDLLRDLRRAIDEQQLELYYQPKIDARSGKITAAEALLRWNHPKRGLIGPGVFIPLAERYGLINALGGWVIDDACRQSRAWRKAGLKMRVAINLSAAQMRQPDLVERILAALRKHGTDPSRLTCEITETVAMEDTEATQRTFARLGEAGMHLSIDDFGTGYSSLAYLRRLPAEELKIDRAFVKDLGASEDARAIVDAVIKMAHALGLRVVAEGVEKQRQHDVLVGLGCDEVQGFLHHKPMRANELLLKALAGGDGPASFRESLFADTATPTVMHPVTAMQRPTRPFTG
jgi:diguanylate cyclase (GGDEF)-like protein